MKKPAVDLGLCSLCLGCIEMAPEVFRVNDIGYLEVVELPQYPEQAVNEAIKYCPEHCIFWEEGEGK